MTEELTVKSERTHKKIISADGSTVILCTVEVPIIADIKKFNRFYTQVKEKSINFCEKKLMTHYANGGTYSYKLLCRCHVENKRLTVTLKATLGNKDTHRIISSRTEAHIWSFDGILLKTVK